MDTLTLVPKADLEALTGFNRVSAQIRWLHRNGWKFVVNGRGDPVVALAEFNRHMVGGKGAPPTQEPNWDAMNGARRAKSDDRWVVGHSVCSHRLRLTRNLPETFFCLDRLA
jgi:hypothetical protein